MTRVLDNPAHYITLHFDSDEQELRDLFVEYYKEGWAFYARALEEGYWFDPDAGTTCPALTFFTHLKDDIVPMWEDFIGWLTAKEDDVT